jgi:hypothetical protein
VKLPTVIQKGVEETKKDNKLKKGKEETKNCRRQEIKTYCSETWYIRGHNSCHDDHHQPVRTAGADRRL